MKITIRNYDPMHDYEAVNAFLIDSYRPDTYKLWLQPRWEYMHYQFNLNRENLNKIGIFENDGTIIAVVTYENDLGEAYFLIHPDHKHLKPKLFQYAEDNLGKKLESGKHAISIYIHESDRRLEKIATRKRYNKDEENLNSKTYSIFPIETPLPKPILPDGYRLISLEDENDLEKLHRLICRGFEQKGEVPHDGVWWQKLSQSAPSFDKSLHIVIVAPNGQYVSYSGIWFESIHKTAYLKPVCTDPDYRLKGLAKACVIECIRRVKEKDAHEIFVNASDPFYQAIGFEPQFIFYNWRKEY